MKSITGKTIVEVRPMTEEEMRRESWSRGTTAIVLSNGAILYPSQDEEGNGPGELFGYDPKEKSTFYVFPSKEFNYELDKL